MYADGAGSGATADQQQAGSPAKGRNGTAARSAAEVMAEEGHAGGGGGLNGGAREWTRMRRGERRKDERAR